MEAQEFREAAKAAIDESKSLYHNHNTIMTPLESQ
jgi:hypothetical protein